MAPSAINDGARALEGLLARFHEDIGCRKASTGSANAYVFAAAQTLSAYYDGLIICFDANFGNTGSATLNVDTLGAETIKKHNDQNLASGDIESGQKVLVVYDGTDFQLLSVGALPVPALGVDTGQIAANAVDGTKIAIGSDAQGDVLYYDGTDYARLGAGTSGQFLKTQGAAANPVWADLAAGVAQVVTQVSSALGTGTLTVPNDDTIPQCDSEGTQFMSEVVTPENASSTLIIEVIFYGAVASTKTAVVMLCEDTTANAVAAIAASSDTNGNVAIPLTYAATAGGTSQKKYIVRAGLTAAGTITFNGAASARKFGGVAASSINIMEVLP